MQIDLALKMNQEKDLWIIRNLRKSKAPIENVLSLAIR